MNGGLLDSASKFDQAPDRRIYGVALAKVINNVDMLGLGRVQLLLPWLPGFEPWARVAVPQAGSEMGTYFLPQIDDEVLVAFQQGELTDPFVIGSLWNGQDKPPATNPQDPTFIRMIRTPLGHEILFDDMQQSITITSSTDQKITIEPGKIEISTTSSTARITLENSGSISIVSAISIDLNAPMINLQGDDISIQSTASTEIQGGASCSLQAAIIRIN